MEYFVSEESILRQIWGKGDTILIIFAGAAAEFALNKAVDWLYFTGSLPADPLGRLFSTVRYARQIVFAERQAALQSIKQINAIHAGVEAARGSRIPDWAYRDVLFMLIDYSIRAYELMERRLTAAEKQQVFEEFSRLGLHMQLQGLPKSYLEWKHMRQRHLQENLIRSPLTDDLYQQYRKHLGPVRYRVLLETQMLVVPPLVRQQLNFRGISLLSPVLDLYKGLRRLKLEWLLKRVLLPPAYLDQIRELDIATR